MKEILQQRHKKIMEEFLAALNKETDRFILKGGTGLLLCYGLDRFSEDIDLDCEQQKLTGFIDKFCKARGFSYRIAKDTPTVNRFILHCSGQPEIRLKIEISYRNKCILPTTHTKIHGIEVYTIDRLCQLKTSAYQGRDKIRDLYDICFICMYYFGKLSDSTKEQLKDALVYKGFEHYDYLASMQDDTLVDKEKLADMYLSMYEKLDLLYTQEEKQQIQRPQRTDDAYQKEDDGARHFR